MHGPHQPNSGTALLIGPAFAGRVVATSADSSRLAAALVRLPGAGDGAQGRQPSLLAVASVYLPPQHQTEAHQRAIAAATIADLLVLRERWHDARHWAILGDLNDDDSARDGANAAAGVDVAELAAIAAAAAVAATPATETRLRQRLADTVAAALRQRGDTLHLLRVTFNATDGFRDAFPDVQASPGHTRQPYLRRPRGDAAAAADDFGAARQQRPSRLDYGLFGARGRETAAWSRGQVGATRLQTPATMSDHLPLAFVFDARALFPHWPSLHQWRAAQDERYDGAWAIEPPLHAAPGWLDTTSAEHTAAEAAVRASFEAAEGAADLLRTACATTQDALRDEAEPEAARAVANRLYSLLQRGASEAHAAASGRRHRPVVNAGRHHTRKPTTPAAAALERQEAQLQDEARRLLHRLHELGTHVLDADRADDGLVLRLARAESKATADALDDVYQRAARAGFARFQEDMRAWHNGETQHGLRRFFATLRTGGGRRTAWPRDVEPTVMAANLHLPPQDARHGKAQLVTGVQATRAAVRDHFRHIYRPTEEEADEELLDEVYARRRVPEAREPTTTGTAPFTAAEVVEVLREATAKTGGWSKSTGPDGVATGLWLVIADMPAPTGTGAHMTVADWLATLFNLCRAAGVVPDAWKRATLCLIPKAGQTDTVSVAPDLRKLRSISLLSTAYKCFERLLMRRAGNRLKAALEAEQGVVTGAVRGGVSTIVAALLDTVDTTLEATRRAGPPKRSARRDLTDDELLEMEAESDAPEALGVLSVDFMKAFDRVPHTALPRALRRIGAPAWLVRLVADAHTGLEATVRLPGVGKAQATDTFAVGAGVRQGSVWGPLLFAIVLDPLVAAAREASCEHDGYLAANRLPGVLAYADDVSLLATSARSMQAMVEQLRRFSDATGMAVNESKCSLAIFADTAARRARSLGLQTADNDHAVVGHMRVPVATEFRYLGYRLSTNRKTDKQAQEVRLEVQRRLAQMARFGLRHEQWLTAYNMWVRPYIAFHGRVWALAETSDLGEHLDKAVRKVARRALGMPRGATNAALHSDLGMGVIPPSDTLRRAALAQLVTTLNEPSAFGRLARDRWGEVSDRLGMASAQGALAVPRLAATQG
ncbi:MAG: reverse transcriptase family protein, partial [Planctomycetota bacterium]